MGNFLKRAEKILLLTLTLVKGYGCYMESKYIEYIYDVITQKGCAIKA